MRHGVALHESLHDGHALAAQACHSSRSVHTPATCQHSGGIYAPLAMSARAARSAPHASALPVPYLRACACACIQVAAWQVRCVCTRAASRWTAPRCEAQRSPSALRRAPRCERGTRAAGRSHAGGAGHTIAVAVAVGVEIERCGEVDVGCSSLSAVQPLRRDGIAPDAFGCVARCGVVWCQRQRAA